MRVSRFTLRAPAALAARWRNVALLSWPVDDALLEPLLPAGLVLDRWRDRAYISLVGLRFENVRVLGLPAPLRSYEEVNLRFYVRTPPGVAEGGPGVVFVRQLVPHRLTAWVARCAYGEPFSAASMCHRFSGSDDGTPSGVCRVAYGWRSNDRQHRFWLESDAAPARPAPGSLGEFLTARYWGYNGKPSGPTRAYNLTRPAWPTRPACSWEFDCDAVSLYGPGFGAAMSAVPASALLAAGSWAKVNWPKRLRDGFR